MKKGGLMLLLALALLGCGKKQVTTEVQQPLPVTQVTGLGKVVPKGGVSELASPASGIVVQLPVESGMKVKKGDVLLRLDNTDQAIAVSEYDSRITSQRRQIGSAQLLIDRKKIEVGDKLRKLNDGKALLEAGATSGENVRNLQNDYDLARQELKKLENDLAVQQSQLREVQAQKTARTAGLQKATLQAPMDGTLLDILPRLGEAVSQYQTYARLAPDAPLVVLAEIDEMFSDNLKIGQPCTILLVNDKKQVATGKIAVISTSLKRKSLFADNGEDLEDRRVREIEVELDSTPTTLLIETKVECTVDIK